MKTAAISRFVMMAAIAVVVVAGVTPVLAQSPNFPNFSSLANLSTNGTAAQSGTVLRLTRTLQGQDGSAWFNVKQPVTGSFTTTFTFQISNDQVDNPFPADGIAFVIQNSPVNDGGGGTGALGGAGGGIGFDGIPNSLAVEFDTFPNGSLDNNNANHVAVQSCGNAPNTVDEASSCSLGQNYGLPIILADQSPHTATITYAPPPTGSGPGRLDVILDNTDLFPAKTGEGAHPAGVSFDPTTLGLDNGTAWVGFTGATGALVENNDILSWTFTPQTQSVALPEPGVQGIANFSGGVSQGGFDQTATIAAASPVTSATLNIKAIPTDRNVCNQLVHQTFPLAQCFVFQNADGKGAHKAVLFELTCSNAQGDCGPDIVADLGNDFVFQNSDNPGFKLLSSTIGGYVGVLKGESGSPNGSCQTDSGAHPLKFTSNQISSFTLSGDPLGGTTQKSKPGTSCWTIVYAVTGERPPGITIASPTATNYTQNTIVPTLQASYTCKTPVTSNNPDPNVTSPIGPYLTVGSCSQSQAPNNSTANACGTFDPVLSFTGGVACTGAFDVSTLGLHVFLVTTKDTAGNLNAKAVVYNVVKPPKH